MVSSIIPFHAAHNVWMPMINIFFVLMMPFSGAVRFGGFGQRIVDTRKWFEGLNTRFAI